ncbi:RCC1 domain-containing protein [Anaerosacchariphilus polymeriproducens]|uniref:Chromosome condensation regulator n=1 Tax=Anaerosacchariphilus polymeriproducens TaxID=1812858 RepID=A0A371AX28_9FIRM|nr:hypothetical protein [Anaerosacchariphilus polymeriproducens]RDU24144.1 hypothetical protein DWV06_05445 [Anaerosacchariphilus polymeriproducens]
MKSKKIRVVLTLVFILVCIFSICSCNHITKEKKEKEPPLEPVDKKRAEIESYQNLVAVGGFHMLGVKADGTTYSWGENKYGECNTQDWTNVVAVSAGAYISVGLKSDGTVVATGCNDLGQCETEDWTDIVEISACDTHILGLKSDGTVVSTGRIVPEEGAGEQTIQTRNEMVENWKDIKHVVAYVNSATGIKLDKSAIWSHYGGYMPYTNKVETGTMGLNNIIEIKKEGFFWMCLLSDGTVKLRDSYDDKTGEKWTDIVDIATGAEHYVGLKSNGRVLCSGSNEYNQCEGVEAWEDIIAIYSGNRITVGLQEDGTLIFSGDSTKALTENPEEGQVDPKEWDLF